MSTTTIMTVREARRRLQDTSRLSADQIDEAQKVVTAFHDARPPRGSSCVACNCAVFSEHETADGNASWACASCHRSSTLTAEEWHAQRSAAEAVRRVRDKTAADAVPEPHKALQDALAARAGARGALERLEAAVTAARATLADAQVRSDAASAAMEAAEASAGFRLAASWTGAKAAPAGTTVGAARGQVTAAADALAAARSAKGLLDGQLAEARRAVSFAEDRVRRAALSVVSAEHLEDLIETAVNARAIYVETIGGLSFLIRNGAIPSGDIRPNQLVREGDTPPSTWREAQNADGGMTARLNALLAGAP